MLLIVGLPCLASFLWPIISLFGQFCSMLITSSLKFHSSLYLSFVLQLNAGRFMMGLFILSPALPCVDVPAVAMVWMPPMLLWLLLAWWIHFDLFFVCHFHLCHWILAISIWVCLYEIAFLLSYIFADTA